MDHEGPNFGYAYGESAAASWNPALRPASRVPSPSVPSPENETQAEAPDSHNESSTWQNGNLHADNGSPSGSTDARIFGEEEASLESVLDAQPPSDSSTFDADARSSDVAPKSSVLDGTSGEPTGAAADFLSYSTPATTDAPETIQDTTSFACTPLYPESTSQSIAPVSNDASKERTAEENYEHQGGSTSLEDAFRERADEPLVENDANAIDWHNIGNEEFGFEAGDAIPAGEERSVGLNDELAASETAPAPAGSVRAAEPVIDWGASEESEFSFAGQAVTKSEVDFAAAFADEDEAAQDPFSNDKATKEPERPLGPDLAAWQAAFGDDELLDEGGASGGPSFFEDDGEGFLDDTPAPADDTSKTFPTHPGTAGLTNSTASRYSPAPTQTQTQVRAPSNPYVPSGPQFTDVSQMDKTQARPSNAFPPFGQPAPHSMPQPQSGAQSSGQSFADKAKTGYASPYDLPEALSKPRRRAAPSATSRQGQPGAPPPPPRTSSLGSMPGVDFARAQSVSGMPPPTQGRPPTSGSGQVRPPSSGSAYGAPSQKPSLDKSPSLPKSGSSSFFEDLPVVTKPRGPPSSGRYTPQPSQSPQTPQGQFQPNFGQSSAPPVGGTQRHSLPPPSSQSRSIQQRQTPMAKDSYSQFQQPDRPPMFPDQPTHVPAGSVPSPHPSTRYSPAPAAPDSSTAPPAIGNNRYSPAPPLQLAGASSITSYAADPSGPSRGPSKHFAPRTSSPLAQFTSSPQVEEPEQVHQKPLPQPPLANYPQATQQQQSSSRPESFMQPSHPRQNGYASAAPPHGAKSTTTPPPHAPPSTSPRKKSYAPSSQLPPVSEQGAVPPMRSQSQSPGSRMRNKNLGITPIDRPASAFELPSPKRAPVQPVRAASLDHRRQFSQGKQFMQPQDERAHDPLERWKGCPIFFWGAGGRAVSTFPKYAPRYAGSQTFYTPSAGEVKLLDVKDLGPASGILSGFPGPLKKGKKKDVLAWLKIAIAAFENHLRPQFNAPVEQIDRKKLEEKVLLWKIVHVLIEHDGVLEGTPAVQEAVQAVLRNDERPQSPLLLRPSEGLQATNATSAHQVMAEAVNPSVVDRIRGLLSRGEREKAAWLAVDERLWGHAMLISSTVSKDIWKQVIQEFVRKEVKSAGTDNEPLSALYEVFAGNWEESIDQLVPASARAGFQMISTVDSSGGVKDASMGLDKWRETLLMILSNRTTDDHQALIALGRLLAGYGRIEAAHICYLFARQTIYIGGAEDPQSQMILLGSDPRLHLDSSRDQETQIADYYMESIMLTEVYEFALSLATSASHAIPHLQAYKLHHASSLAEAGFKNEAQQYCDTIAALVGSKTRRSPYYHAHFEQQLEDLTKRLSQAPTASSSWITKPTVDKVSTSLFAKFNSFVAGDESETASQGSNPANEVGPFARIPGDTPNISRRTSAVDLYGAFANGGTATTSAPPQSTVNSRYAPSHSSVYAPRTSSEHAKPIPHAPQSGRSSFDFTRPGENVHSPGGGDHGSHGALHAPFGQPPGSSPSQAMQSPSHYSPPQPRSYAPTSSKPAGISSYQGMPNANGAAGSLSPQGIHSPPQNAYSPMTYQGTPTLEGTTLKSAYEPLQSSPQHQLYQQGSYEPQVPEPQDEPRGYFSVGSQPPSMQPASFDDRLPSQPSNQQATSSYEPPDSSYVPPTSSYEPPSYQPYIPEPDSAADVDKTSEEDEKKPKKKSFMDDDDEDDLRTRAAALKSQQTDNDRAADEAFRKAAEADAKRPQNLQHKSSWFGGWFGKKDPNAPQTGPIKAKLGEENSFVYDPDLKKWVNKKAGAEQLATAAPTPPPPKGPLGRGTPPPSGLRAASGPPSSLGMGAMGAPAPRAASASMAPKGGPLVSGPPSRAGTPADLAGPPGEVAGVPTLGSGPPSRPPTSMSNASSIDDLIGPAAARKGGAKKKGRGGRYIDVMANQAGS